MVSEIAFEPHSHTYSVAGRMVPSVTQVLEDCGIIDYSQIPDGTRVMALERGRCVHLVCQLDDENDLGPYGPSLQGYLDAWRRFRDDYHFIADLIEHRGYSETYRYAGTLDRMGFFGEDRDNVSVLLDLKTSQAPYWTAYQLAAYAGFFKEPRKLRRMAVALHSDGTYKVHEYRSADYARDLNIFLSALTVWSAKRAV